MGKSENAAVRKSARQRSISNDITDEFDKVRHLFTTIGTQLEVHWSEEDLFGMSWKSGWYRGEVQSYHEDEDNIQVMYEKDRTNMYSICVMAELLEGIICPG